MERERPKEMSGADDQGRRLQFRFSRTADAKPAVPASVLIQTLHGAQRAIWLIALAQEQKDIKTRARIPSEIEQRYQLKCEVPQPGSYVLPAFVESIQPQLATTDQVNEVLDAFEGVAAGLQSKQRDKVASYLPDTAIRKRVVDAFQQLAPKPGSGWKLDLSRNGTTVHMDDNWQRLVRKMYATTETEPDRETVNGELIEINFADRQITILPIGSNRQLKVTYQDAMEDLLLENRKSKIQITGRVSRDENGEIKNMFDLESIGTLDLSPLEVDEVEYEGLRLRFKETVRLQPHLNEDNPQFVSIEEPRFGLDAFAGTVGDLLDEVAEDLVIVWKHYAKAPDSELSPRALELKRRLIAAMEEVPVVG
jgi:hypothetical protein